MRFNIQSKINKNVINNYSFPLLLFSNFHFTLRTDRLLGYGFIIMIINSFLLFLYNCFQALFNFRLIVLCLRNTITNNVSLFRSMKDFMDCWQIHDAGLHIISTFSVFSKESNIKVHIKLWKLAKSEALYFMFHILNVIVNRRYLDLLKQFYKWVSIYFWIMRYCAWNRWNFFHLFLPAAGYLVQWTDFQKQSTFCWINNVSMTSDKWHIGN